MLKDTRLAADFPLALLAERTDGLSGSDLKELCRNAAMVPMRELMRQAEHPDEMKRIAEEVRLDVLGSHLRVSDIYDRSQNVQLRPLTLHDFFTTDNTSALPPPDFQAVFSRLTANIP